MVCGNSPSTRSMITAFTLIPSPSPPPRRFSKCWNRRGDLPPRRMNPAEALAIVERCAGNDEIDRLLVDLLRYPSPQTERLEADPALKKFIADAIAPRITELTGSAGTLDAMGNLVWRSGDSASGGLLLMGYAMTFPAASMAEPFSGAIVDGAPFGIASRCVVGRGACEQK